MVLGVVERAEVRWPPLVDGEHEQDQPDEHAATPPPISPFSS